MDKTAFPDKYDWRGCGAVRFDPERLGGRATVLNTRMDADGVIANYLNGMSVDELYDHYRCNKDAMRAIIAFFEARYRKISA